MINYCAMHFVTNNKNDYINKIVVTEIAVYPCCVVNYYVIY